MELERLVFNLVQRICLMFVVCGDSAKDIQDEFEEFYDLILTLQNLYPKELGSRIKLFYIVKRTIKSCNEDDKMYNHSVSMRFAVSTTTTYFKKNLMVLAKRLCDVENKRLLLSPIESIQHIVGLFRKSSEFYWQMIRQALHYSTCCKPDQHTPIEIYSIRICQYLVFYRSASIEARKVFLNALLKEYPFIQKIYNQLLHKK